MTTREYSHARPFSGRLCVPDATVRPIPERTLDAGTTVRTMAPGLDLLLRGTRPSAIPM